MPSPKLTVELVQQVCGVGTTISDRLTGGVTITTGNGGIVAAERQVLRAVGDAATVAMAARLERLQLDERPQDAASPDPTFKERPGREKAVFARVE